MLLFSHSVMFDSDNPMDCSTPGFSILHYLPEFGWTHVQWVNDAIQPSHPLPSPPALNLSQHHGLFQWVGTSHQVAKLWSFSISPSYEYSGLISFRIDWFDLLAVQGTLRSLLQHHRLKASVLQHSAFFTVQLSQPYMTTGKTIALTTQTFVGRIMSLPFNALSMSSLSCQEAIVFWVHGCSHHPQWFWSPRRGHLSLLKHFPLLSAMQSWGRMP